ncbi:NADH-ubiquinone oxidoreductase 12 kDa subunit, mitochondrial precursor [Pseudozyma hubeiensis SY62]|uniref:NADH-ubiquinone oxidoreductase 12 kDa subunit, mitochondrial n=1 Tax=Pseudozyma hubeiensis (strain SY62) TaxID=1305764 RepID=R9PAJ7_PSEHS|nr:NADH-ubiquinone oxidoreductase 12 kDa subunit, mitochondrial precursor [Pseudozyma hubeiensis SY62]GAC98354.1 NADH-ubiquinone oxidoreductase 12 kDa subunit, mitochondrial precursor [Pseudozyma hubeiensis SY62]
MDKLPSAEEMRALLTTHTSLFTLDHDSCSLVRHRTICPIDTHLAINRTSHRLRHPNLSSGTYLPKTSHRLLPPTASNHTETLSQREEKVRESWVRTMEARIVREELQKCHKAEGVNHYQACSDLAKKYHSLLADAKIND